MELINATLGGLLEKWAREIPDHDFIVYPDRGLLFNYKEFNERVDNIAKGLVEIGVKKDDKVGVWAKNVPDWLTFFFASAKIGAVLPERLKPFLFDAGLMVPPFDHVIRDSVDVAQLRTAIREGRKVELLYRAEDGKESRRVIWPIGVAYYDAQRLILAWCELRNAFRSFRTDRMISAEVLDMKYPARRKALLKQMHEEIEGQFGVAHVDVFG